MAQREEEANGDRSLATLHQRSGDVVDGGDVVRVDRVAEAEAIGQERGAQQQGLAVEEEEGPGPGAGVGQDEEGIHADEAAAEAGGRRSVGVASRTGSGVRHGGPRLLRFALLGDTQIGSSCA